LGHRLLHPLLDRRDILGIAQTNISATLNSNRKALTRIEAENLSISEKNRRLVANLVGLTEQIDTQRSTAIDESNLAHQVEKLKLDHEVAKRRWRTMKSVVAAIIVGSGIDWARDSVLKRLVLDKDE
jgi:hypothetical protein